jgi:hypothetical protein
MPHRPLSSDDVMMQNMFPTRTLLVGSGFVKAAWTYGSTSCDESPIGNARALAEGSMR